MFYVPGMPGISSSGVCRKGSCIHLHGGHVEDRRVHGDICNPDIQRDVVEGHRDAFLGDQLEFPAALGPVELECQWRMLQDMQRALEWCIISVG